MRVHSLMSADTTRCHGHCRRSLSSSAVGLCGGRDLRSGGCAGADKKELAARRAFSRAASLAPPHTRAARASGDGLVPRPPRRPPRPLARRTRARVRSRSLASRPGGSLAGHARGSVRSRPLVSRARAGVAPRGERESGRDPPSDVMSITLEHRCVLTPRPTRRARAPRARRASRGPATATTVRSRRRRARHLSFPPLGGGPTSTASGAHARPS